MRSAIAASHMSTCLAPSALPTDLRDSFPLTGTIATACPPSAVTRSVLNTCSGSSPSLSAASSPKSRNDSPRSYSWIVNTTPADSSSRTAGVIVHQYVLAVRITADPSTSSGDYEFCHRVRVRFAETDAMGIVHHSRYLPIMEEARVAYLRDIDHPYQSVRDDGFDFTVLEVSVQYRQPIRFDEVVDVHLSLSQVDRASFQM